jgi:RNA polymerase sigma-70 factor, ECF subfamily
MVGCESADKVLVERAQRDPRRFADLYTAHFDRVYAFIARRVPGRLDAQDLTSDVFQQALANLARYEWRGVPFAAWLYRIAANAVADHHARTARTRALPPAEDPGPPQGFGEAERRASLYRAVRALPNDQRRVIELRFAEDRSTAEIAAALGRSEGAVKQLQFRAIKALRQRLDQDDA